jgi:hypothetical protein
LIFFHSRRIQGRHHRLPAPGAKWATKRLGEFAWQADNSLPIFRSGGWSVADKTSGSFHVSSFHTPILAGHELALSSLCTLI